ncbi:hypothetical protein [Streptomyces bohaiensis]|uniref:Head-tail adaptor protein n=1 Tax=Streptomyces bohaiensis TaxID=1431344 RepID=A0ABX1C806_9ACTN|nr:hypothetical protein [Streptomyces bohaiensis]NJQ14223.1 hypothetical protein [Streptomyces bohaiensis]
MSAIGAAWWHRDRLTRVRADVVADAYGNPTRDWPNAVRAELPGEWRVQPMPGVDVDTAETLPRDGLDRSRRAYGPLDADVLATDRIEWDGETWVISGEIGRHRSPTGAIDHTVMTLTRMEG